MGPIEPFRPYCLCCPHATCWAVRQEASHIRSHKREVHEFSDLLPSPQRSQRQHVGPDHIVKTFGLRALPPPIAAASSSEVSYLPNQTKDYHWTVYEDLTSLLAALTAAKTAAEKFDFRGRFSAGKLLLVRSMYYKVSEMHWIDFSMSQASVLLEGQPFCHIDASVLSRGA